VFGFARPYRLSPQTSGGKTDRSRQNRNSRGSRDITYGPPEVPAIPSTGAGRRHPAAAPGWVADYGVLVLAGRNSPPEPAMVFRCMASGSRLVGSGSCRVRRTEQCVQRGSCQAPECRVTWEAGARRRVRPLGRGRCVLAAGSRGLRRSRTPGRPHCQPCLGATHVVPAFARSGPRFSAGGRGDRVGR
jgi:hypothetical protein